MQASSLTDDNRLRQTIDEEQRLQALAEYGLNDGPLHPDCLHLVKLLRERCGMNWAAVTLVERDRQIFRARDGFDTIHTPRSVSFCSVAMHLNEPLIVEDARRDRRFAHNPLVTGDPHIRFYAGFPLVSSEGHPLGALCVIDMEPRTLFHSQIDFLSRARDWVKASLEMRRLIRKHTQSAKGDLASTPENQKLLRFAQIRADRAWSHIVDPLHRRPLPPRAQSALPRSSGLHNYAAPLSCLCSLTTSLQQTA